LRVIDQDFNAVIKSWIAA